MGNYVISCCSTADLSKDHFDAIDVKYICFHFELDGKQYEDNLGSAFRLTSFIPVWQMAQIQRLLR